MRPIVKLTSRNLQPHIALHAGGWCIFWRHRRTGEIYPISRIHLMTLSSTAAAQARAFARARNKAEGRPA